MKVYFLFLTLKSDKTPLTTFKLFISPPCYLYIIPDSVISGCPAISSIWQTLGITVAASKSDDVFIMAELSFSLFSSGAQPSPLYGKRWASKSDDELWALAPRPSKWAGQRPLALYSANYPMATLGRAEQRDLPARTLFNHSGHCACD